MILRITLVAILCFCSAQAVLNKEVKRREAFDSYGPPPRPAPQYGPPAAPQRQPHREYGVPQQIPFREYGPPALKYGPPKFNFLHSSSGSSQNQGLYEQIKSHFGVPKPFYGPPHRPQQSYGPPPHQPQQQYGPPKQQYGLPPQQHRPQPNYGPPPKPVYGSPPPQALPLRIPSPAFKPEHQPASSYGPPPSGPIHPLKQSYGSPPHSTYGPPPLPVFLPNLQSTNFNRGQEATIVIGGGGGHHQQFGGEPVKQVQIQIDSAGHTHSVSGSQTPFHTACDGWKPIPAPVGSFVEHNNIESQGGYDQAHLGLASNGFIQTQYSSNSGHANSNGGGNSGGGGGGSSIVDGLTDEQLVAIALQSEAPKGGTNILGVPQVADNLNNNHILNSIEEEAVQLSLGGLVDSYSKPPSDSFAPGSIQAQKYNGPEDSYGAPASGNFGPPPPQTASQEQKFNNFLPGSQPSRPVAYRPPVPQGLLESIGATVSHLEQFGVKPPQQSPTYIPPAVNEIPASGSSNIDNEYGPPPPLPPVQDLPLQEKPPQEIIEQQLPQARPPQFFAQPQQRPQFNSFQQQQQQHHHHQQQQQPQRPQGPQFNFLPQLQEPRNQYVPPPLPLTQPPQSQYLPPPPLLPQQQQQRPLPPHTQYLPPPFPAGSNPSINFQQHQQQQQHQHSSSQFTSSGAASVLNEQFIHTQGLPVQQSVQFNQVPHNCGHGPNLIGNNFQVQQQQQGQFQDLQHYASAGSSNAYNAITQSIPVAESHSQFLETPDNSYGPPANGNDHEGYASQRNGVATLPDGTNPQDLPGLEGLNGLNVISAQKSQSIDITANNQQTQNKYQLELTENPGSQGAHHEEILSQGLLQSILSAIEEPKSAQAQQQNQFQQIASNHNYGSNIYDAQSRSDTVNYENDKDDDKDDGETAVAEASQKTETKVEFEKDTKGSENVKVTKIMPIVAEEYPEAE